MTKLTEEQKQKITHTCAAVHELSEAQDKLFNDLVKELQLHEIDVDNVMTDTGSFAWTNKHPVDWLFDIVYNSRNSKEEAFGIIRLEQSISEMITALAHKQEL